MKKIFLVAAVLLALSGLALATTTTTTINPYIPTTPGYVIGQTTIVNTQASITGGGTPPVVEYAWVLPDEDPLTAGTQIWPYASTERTNLYACVVVSDPNGRDNVADVYIDVYHPQGQPLCASFKYQKHGVKLDIVSNKADIEACKTAALNAGLITQAEYTDINYNIFNQTKYFMYKVDLKCNYCQPAGEYEARTFAVDQQGGVATPKSPKFTWIPSVILQIDFYNGVKFGEIIPGVEQTIQGDDNMLTNESPTVKNEGNVPIEISLNNSKMIGKTYKKDILDFDAMFRSEYKTYKALEKVTFANSLELCNTRKIDFSVKAPLGTPVDLYEGAITVIAAQGNYELPGCS